MRKFGIASLVVALLVSSAWAQDKKGKTASPPPPAPEAAPEMVSVTVTREADIRQGVAEAKEEATNRALRAAVEQVVGTHVSAFSESRDFTMLQDYVTSQTTGYVSSYELVNEQVSEEEVVVTVKAQVSKGKIDADSAAIATLLAQRKQRYIYVSVNDRSSGSMGGEDAKTAVLVRHGKFDAVLREQLRKDGFITLDPNMVDGQLSVGSAVEAITGVRDAVSIAKAVKADVIIYGHVITEVVSRQSEYVKDVRTALANVSISIVDPHTEEEIGSYVSESKGVAHLPEVASKLAIDKAATDAVREARRALFAAWLKQQQSGSTVKITVNGLKRYGDLGELQRMLTNSSHQIKSVASSQFAKGTGTFALMVGPGVTSDSLANDLGGMAFKGQTISVTAVRPSVLELELAK